MRHKALGSGTDDTGQNQSTGQHPQADPGSIDWQSLISTATRPAAVQAHTFFKKYETAAKPVELMCADGSRYVVKGLRKDDKQGRMLFNDCVAARLGQFIGAPVPDAALIEITKDLIDANSDKTQMGHLVPCIAHGSRRIENVTERINSLDHVDENRVRYASLAIFFGWLSVSDMQFIFRKSSPHLVYSHDHGHFFPGGPNWTTTTLGGAPDVKPENKLVTELKLTPVELTDACALLQSLTLKQPAEALAMPPDSWGVTMEERVALAEFLHKRRVQLLASCALDDDDDDDGEQEKSI